jgi:hypothetical protein
MDVGRCCSELTSGAGAEFTGATCPTCLSCFQHRSGISSQSSSNRSVSACADTRTTTKFFLWMTVRRTPAKPLAISASADRNGPPRDWISEG